MRSGPGCWIGLALLILPPALGFLGWEYVQWQRSSAVEARITARIKDFQSKADVSGDAGRRLLLPGQKPDGDGRFTVAIATEDGGGASVERQTDWHAYAPLLGPDGGSDILEVNVHLSQERKLLLQIPRVRVTFNSRRHPAIELLLRDSLRDIPYDYFPWDHCGKSKNP
jgi:hypothetical protein